MTTETSESIALRALLPVQTVEYRAKLIDLVKSLETSHNKACIKKALKIISTYPKHDIVYVLSEIDAAMCDPKWVKLTRPTSRNLVMIILRDRLLSLAKAICEMGFSEYSMMFMDICERSNGTDFARAAAVSNFEKLRGDYKICRLFGGDQMFIGGH